VFSSFVIPFVRAALLEFDFPRSNCWTWSRTWLSHVRS